MPSRVLETKQEIEDFVRGCTFYGTGGGGLPENGIESLVNEMDGGRQIGWVDVDDIPDNVLTVCPFLMGSIAPHTPAVIEEMKGFGLVKPVNKEKDTLSKAIIELSQYVGKKVSAVVPIELGGANTLRCHRRRLDERHPGGRRRLYRARHPRSTSDHPIPSRENTLADIMC